jgi:ankyrin repeat protein
MAYRSVSLLALVASLILTMPAALPHAGFPAFAGGAAAQSADSSPASPAEALFSALQRGATAEVNHLLASGGNANAVDAGGTPALMVAALHGSAGLMEALLKRGADANATDTAGATALMWAVSDLAKVRLLLQHGARVDTRSKTGRTALLVATAYPRTLDVVRLLAERGADVRAEDQGRTSALALATRASDIDVVRFLVSRGLDPRTLSAGARRAAHVRHDPPTIDFLMSKDVSPAPETMTWAAMWHAPALVSKWIAAGGDVNAASAAAQYSRTPLMTAVTSEDALPETVRLLLERGADPNARTPEGESALDWAIYKGDRAKIALLERYGAMRGNGPRGEEIPPPVRSEAANPRLAVSRSVARLTDVAPRFREQTGCISCHHNALPALAAAAARRKGIEVAGAQAQKNLDDIAGFFRSNASRMMQGDPAVGGEALTAGYALMAMKAEGYLPDAVTATMTHWLMARQMPDGRWLGNGVNRPPSEYSTISHTAIAAGGVRAYPLSGRARDVKETLQRAREWLASANASSAEERALRLMGLVWTEASRDRIASAVRDIRGAQHVSGGWSQFGRTDPDAYATGQSLYALRLAGITPDDRAYREGVAFLLKTQYPDGSWLVRTHSFPVQRYFESGFPFGRHQWISTAGTSWAALALAEAMP